MKKKKLTYAQRIFTEEQLSAMKELRVRQIHHYNTAKTTADTLDALEYIDTINKIIHRLEKILKEGYQ